MKSIQPLGCMAAFLAFLASGCSTSVKVSEFTPPVEVGAEVNGIPFQIKERYQIDVYQLVNGRYQKAGANVSGKDFPVLTNQEHMYLLQLDGDVLSDGVVQIKMNPDNTLSLVSVSSTSKVQAALTELGTSAKSLSDNKAARDKAGTDAVKAGETGLQSTENAYVDYLTTKTDADVAEFQRLAITDSTTPLDRLKLEAAAMKAKVIANQKARRAGQVLPFVDAGL